MYAGSSPGTRSRDRSGCAGWGQRVHRRRRSLRLPALDQATPRQGSHRSLPVNSLRPGRLRQLQNPALPVNHAKEGASGQSPGPALSTNTLRAWIVRRCRRETRISIRCALPSRSEASGSNASRGRAEELTFERFEEPSSRGGPRLFDATGFARQIECSRRRSRGGVACHTRSRFTHRVRLGHRSWHLQRGNGSGEVERVDTNTCDSCRLDLYVRSRPASTRDVDTRRR